MLIIYKDDHHSSVAYLNAVSLVCGTPFAEVYNHLLRHRDLYIILIFYVLDSIFRYNLDKNTLEINWQAALQFLRAHPQDLQALFVIDIWVVMLVQ